MSNGFPSMTALLGLLAVAGYQNRDKIGELLGGLGQQPTGAGAGQSSQGGLGGLLGGLGGQGQQGGGLGGLLGGQGGLGGLLGGLMGAGGAMGGAGAGGAMPGGPGGFLGNGLSELRERFAQGGQRDAVESWVGTGPNREIAPTELEQAIGPDVIQSLEQQTGLSRDELLSRLTRELPSAVDKYTPDGRLPA